MNILIINGSPRKNRKQEKSGDKQQALEKVKKSRDKAQQHAE